MKLYFISLAAGILIGTIYALLGVRSPAPPMVARPRECLPTLAVACAAVLEAAALGLLMRNRLAHAA